MKKPALILITLITLTVLAVSGALLLEYRAPSGSAPAEPVTIGTTPFEVSGLIFIAEDQKFFEQNGLSPTIRIYDAGINAVDALYAGDVDVATAADFVFARQALGQRPVRGIATIGKSEFHYIVTRKESGIRNVSDMKGRTIGVARGTSGDFFLGRFLELHGLRLSDVRVVDIPPAQVADPLLDGRVDAVSTWDPYAYATEIRLGDDAQVWPDQKGRLMYWMAICRENNATADSTKVRKFLTALKQAEIFAANHPGEAKAIVQTRLRTDDAYIGRVWPNTQLTLTLDESLITAMEDESRWMIANNLTNVTSVPDFRNILDTKTLESVRPGSVKIIQ